MIRPSHVCTKCGAFWKLHKNTWQLLSKECSRCCDNIRMGDHVELLEETEPDSATVLPPDVEAILEAARRVHDSQVIINNEETMLRFRAAFGEIAELKIRLNSFDARTAI